MRARLAGLAVTVVTMALGACHGTSPSAPSAPAAAASPASSSTVTAQNDSPNGVFLITPNPPHGWAPMNVVIGMCKSVDADPDDDLRYTVNWGDGTRTRGACRQEHRYEDGGTYDATACVSDRIPANAPSCHTFNVRLEGGHKLIARRRIPNFFPDNRPCVLFGCDPFAVYVHRFWEPIPVEEAQSASKIEIELVIFDTQEARVGLGSSLGRKRVAFMEGAPILPLQFGRVVYQLTPGQFTAPVDSFSVQITTLGDFGVDHGEVRFYR